MRVLIAGDFCDSGRVSELIRKGSFEELFGDAREVIARPDYAIVNFEFPIAAEWNVPIDKYGPNLKGCNASIEAVRYAGFDAVTLANNHILDYGEQCGVNTKMAITSAGLDTVGFGDDEIKASEVLYKTIDNKGLAIINCCEKEFSIASRTSAGACGFNPIQQFKAINEARTKADYILVIVHGGIENYGLPSPSMKDAFRFFIDAGADAVVGHHQHCFCGYEIYQGKPIIYGIGNFLFDWNGKRNSDWNIGALAEICFGDKVSFTLHPFRQCDNTASITMLKGEELSLFRKEEKMLNSIIVDDSKMFDAYKEFITNNNKCYRDILKPTGRLMCALYKRHLLPGYTNLSQRLALFDYVSCESHRERFLEYLKGKHE